MIGYFAFLLAIFTPVHGLSFVTTFDEEWQEFKARFNKTYPTVTEAFRKKIFAENKHSVAKHNQRFYRGEVPFTAGINQFSDMLPQEFFSSLNRIAHDVTAKNADNDPVFIPPDDDIILPREIDWRLKGAVTGVKNQGLCASGWAFSTTGALEGQHFRKTNKLVSLSEQNLLDCSPMTGACEGGFMDYAFDFITDEGGIDTEASYPYLGIDGHPCAFSKANIGARDRGHVDIPTRNEFALQKAVAAIGPIAAAIDASRDDFIHYARGVYYNPDCNDTVLDHAVLVVGYGTTIDGFDYWTVKNSWGLSWGERGYVRMSRNRGNNCGIATRASFPLV